jgi:hypothetical protein
MINNDLLALPLPNANAMKTLGCYRIGMENDYLIKLIVLVYMVVLLFTDVIAYRIAILLMRDEQ